VIGLRRKINKVGKDTLTVSLPKDWALKNGLKKGTEVEIDVKDHTLTVFGKMKTGEKTVEIEAQDDPESLFRLVRASYFQGADEIKVKFKNKNSMELVEKHLDYFIGFEVIERTSAYWILRSIADIREGEFEKVLKRLFNLVGSMGIYLYESYKKGKLNTFDHIYKLELTVNKLYIFCSRYTNSSGWKQFKTPTLYYILVQKLESIADAFESISQHYTETKRMKMTEQTMKLLEHVIQYFHDMQEHYYNFSIEKFPELFASKTELTKKSSRLYKTVSREELLLISKLMDAIILVWDAISNIFDIKAAENPEGVGIFQK